MGVHRRRPVIQLLWLCLLFIFIVDRCLCSRRSPLEVYKIRPKPPRNMGDFFGYLPKTVPFPYSAPSKRHNDIGLQSWRTP